jgi:excisionase family DNA binding protein
MTLMTVEQVAEFLGVQDLRVQRLERKSLLPATKKDAADKPLFEKEAVEEYRTLAERLGGL